MESLKDRKEGIDVEIKYKGKLLIAKVKHATEIIESNGNYEIVTKSRVKRYYTNWMIFIKDSKKVYVFDTKNVKIVNGQYIVPTEHLLFKLE